LANRESLSLATGSVLHVAVAFAKMRLKLNIALLGLSQLHIE